tara:strand:+ start:82669 stop:85506 length:2838 start_codon:yes stop_codon:yes gene_type:complete
MVINLFKVYIFLTVIGLANNFIVNSQQPNRLTQAEKQEGWQLLFDGKTFTGLKMLTGDGWEIKDGALKAQIGSEHGQKDIITQQRFGNFELVFEFKISNKTNSGVKYAVTDNYPGQEGKYLGLEYQILDNVNFEYPERGELRTLASLYDLIPAETNRNMKPGKWHTSKIVVNGNHIEHWLNGKKVVDYDRSSERFKALVQVSKYKDLKNFGQATEGHILFQNEGSDIAFRSIKIKPLETSLVFPSETNSQFTAINNEDGHRLWLRYEKISDTIFLEAYRKDLRTVILNESSETMKAVKNEIINGLNGLLDTKTPLNLAMTDHSTLVLGTPSNSTEIASLNLQDQLHHLGKEGFLIQRKTVNKKNTIVIAANTDIGVLYGAFHFLRMLQTQQSIEEVSIKSVPKVKLRMANHWDNANRTVERGYAGLSIWEWATLPEYRHPRYTDFARISASLGINGVVINNVNSDARFITDDFLKKIAVLSDIFRPYGIKTYLSINYSSPVTLDGLETADPLNPKVIDWWYKKTEEIYSNIPNFGGFLVKADSEGQPGPKTYGRNHAEGANMLAEALNPYRGIVIWRAFVYGKRQEDRVREAYDEFVPLDGMFNDNVILQVKNGPIDFMPFEPFSPLFGTLQKTNTMIEFQVTQEYLGQGNHLVYKGPMFTETLNADTYTKGEGNTVGNVLAGEVFKYNLTGMAAVTNPGTDRNWTGHPFVQSSWYAFGRLAWDYTYSAEELAEEWIRMTFSNNEMVINKVKEIMMKSAQASINMREPLGLTHIGTGSHYGPAPWSRRSVRFHHADKSGIGFDRTTKGSKAVKQYNAPLDDIFNDIDSVPEEYLLWFHHVGWDHKMKSGRTLWQELVYKYYEGVETVRWMQKEWDSLEGYIDHSRFSHVKALLKIQEKDAVRWRNSCVLYFQTFSEKPIPKELEKPAYNLEYYKNQEKLIYVSKY